MLVSPSALHIRKSFEMTAQHAQALVDLEAQCSDMGLVMEMRCLPCRSIGDNGYCEGDAQPNDDGTMTFSVECGCTKRAYRGSLVAPKPPRPPRPRRIDLTVKPEIAITREQMRVFDDARLALYQLKLQYGMRCLSCQDEDRERDGVRGTQETNANQFVLDCDCTKRIYRGSDVKLEN